MDPWDFADAVDILSKLPENFNELLVSKKWTERKEALETLLQLATDNIRLDPKANYNVIVETLSKIIGKDANINVAAVAAKCVTQLAKGLRKKFAPHANTLAPVIFEKFKEKKATLRDPLVEAVDAIIATTNMEAISDDIAGALGKPNPSVKAQVAQFLFRIFKTMDDQTAPKKVVKALTPVLVKCTGEPDAEVREAAFSALGAIMKAIGKPTAMTMLKEISNDKMKMEQIEKFYDQAVEESKVEAAENAQGTTGSASAGSSEEFAMLQSANTKLVDENTRLTNECSQMKAKLDKAMVANKKLTGDLQVAQQKIAKLEVELKTAQTKAVSQPRLSTAPSASARSAMVRKSIAPPVSKPATPARVNGTAPSRRSLVPQPRPMTTSIASTGVRPASRSGSQTSILPPSSVQIARASGSRLPPPPKV